MFYSIEMGGVSGFLYSKLECENIQYLLVLE